MDMKVLSSGIQYTNLRKTMLDRNLKVLDRLSEVSVFESIPVIDLGCPDTDQIVQQIGDACKNYGFFQGVSLEAVEKMLDVAKEFFSLPVEEKLKLYSDDPSKTMRLSIRFNVKKKQVRNWRDFLRLHCYPLEQ